MFSGCGGLDLGFTGGFTFLNRYYSRHPFSIDWANDNNLAAYRSYRKNLSDHIHCGDIWEYLSSIPKTEQGQAARSRIRVAPAAWTARRWLRIWHFDYACAEKLII